jgi:hypothetical protein
MQARGWPHTHGWPTPCLEPGLLYKVHGWQRSRVQWGCHADSIAEMLSMGLDLPSQQTACTRQSNALLGHWGEAFNANMCSLRKQCAPGAAN